MSIDHNDQQVAEPTVRLCMLRTWPQCFDGYGFNLHAEKTKPANGGTGTAALPFSGGQYVGKVDRGSPAESAGLREGDRIVQVEGVDIEGEPHSKVVARIKKGSSSAEDSPGTGDGDAVSRCSLLVVDRRADTYYKEHNIKVHSDMGLQVLVLRTPEQPTSECLALQQTANTAGTNNVNDSTKQRNDSVDTATVPTTDNSTTTSTTSSTTSTTTTLNLNMTAAELRRRLAESKKQDARRTGCTGDFRQKHDMVDKL